MNVFTTYISLLHKYLPYVVVCQKKRGVYELKKNELGPGPGPANDWTGRGGPGPGPEKIPRTWPGPDFGQSISEAEDEHGYHAIPEVKLQTRFD